MRNLVVNDACPEKELYSSAVEHELQAFMGNKDAANLDDTFEVACPFEPTCDLRFELYIKEYRGIRTVRHGLIGNLCMQQSAYRQSR